MFGLCALAPDLRVPQNVETWAMLCLEVTRGDWYDSGRQTDTTWRVSRRANLQDLILNAKYVLDLSPSEACPGILVITDG